MTESLILAWVLAAALLVLVSGAWVAARLVREFSSRRKDG